MQNCLDIVATQGVYLVPRPRTPVFEAAYNREFAATLSQILHGTVLGHRARRIKYRELADEWPIGRTPPEVKRKYEDEIKAREELEVATSDDSSHGDDGDGDDGRVDPKKGVSAPDPPCRLRHALWLPTPPQSVHDTLLEPCGRKRRRNFGADEEDEEEKDRPTKIHISSTTISVAFAAENALSNGLPEKSRKRRRTRDEGKKHPTMTRVSPFVTRVPLLKNDLPSGSKGKGQKRRRTQDVDDEEEETRKRPLNTLVTTPRNGRRPRICRPRRAEAGRYRYQHELV